MLRHPALRCSLLVLAVLSAAGCASTRPDVELPDVQTREDLVVGLRALGNHVQPLAAGFFTTQPEPVAAYEVTQRDGQVFTLLAFAPEDYELLRGNTAFANVRPKVGLVGTAQDRYRPALGQAKAVEANIFRKEGVVVVFSQIQTDLFYDLQELLGSPTY